MDEACVGEMDLRARHPGGTATVAPVETSATAQSMKVLPLSLTISARTFDDLQHHLCVTTDELQS